MTIGNQEEYIKYRLQKADDSFNDALLLAENNRWNAVINRLYYACFYSVIALLQSNNIKAQTHDGSRTQFGLHFVKSGLIDKKFGKLYTKLFDLRQKGDYGDLFDYDKETASPLIESVKDFIDEIKRHI